MEVRLRLTWAPNRGAQRTREPRRAEGEGRYTVEWQQIRIHRHTTTIRPICNGKKVSTTRETFTPHVLHRQISPYTYTLVAMLWYCGMHVYVCVYTRAVQCKIVLKFPFLCLIVPIQMRTRPFKAQTANTNTRPFVHNHFQAHTHRWVKGSERRASERKRERARAMESTYAYKAPNTS